MNANVGACYTPLHTPLHTYNLDEMLDKAQAFSKKNSSAGKPEELFAYIAKKLNDSHFQSDPRQFVARSEAKQLKRENRFLWPKDEALAFFRQNFS